jgi:hypothetical protein
MGSGRYGWACFAVHQAVAKALKARSLPGWNPRLATALRNDSRWLTGQPSGGEEEPGPPAAT